MVIIPRLNFMVRDSLQVMAYRNTYLQIPSGYARQIETRQLFLRGKRICTPGDYSDIDTYKVRIGTIYFLLLLLL